MVGRTPTYRRATTWTATVVGGVCVCLCASVCACVCACVRACVMCNIYGEVEELVIMLTLLNNLVT